MSEVNENIEKPAPTFGETEVGHEAPSDAFSDYVEFHFKTNGLGDWFYVASVGGKEQFVSQAFSSKEAAAGAVDGLITRFQKGDVVVRVGENHSNTTTP